MCKVPVKKNLKSPSKGILAPIGKVAGPLVSLQPGRPQRFGPLACPIDGPQST